jgi:hypothetical protein
MEWVIGIVSGLITGLIVFVGTFVWRGLVEPWARDLLYRGIEVDGIWKLIDRSEGSESLYGQYETLELQQAASKLTGRLLLIDREGKEPPRSLKVTGFVQDGFVMLSATQDKRDSLGYVSYLARISGSADLLGSAVYYDTGEGHIRCIEATYRRHTSK